MRSLAFSLWMGMTSWLVLEAGAAEPLFAVHGSQMSARVVMAEAPGATTAFRPKPEVVRGLVDRGITRFTEKSNAAAAWHSLVGPQDVVGLKVFSAPGGYSGTRVAVTEAVVQGLLGAGLKASNIVIWDRQLTDLRLAGYAELAERYGLQLAGSTQAGYDEGVFYEHELLGNLLWGDLEFGKKGPKVGRKSYVTKLLTSKITKIINIAPLLNHNVAGVAGTLYSLGLGSVDNTFRFESNPQRMDEALPELFALEAVGDKVVLNMIDALICQYQGEQSSLLHYAAPLNQVWFSKDPVALDVLAIDELERQRKVSKTTGTKPRMQIYENATQLELGINETKRIKIEMAR